MSENEQKPTAEVSQSVKVTVTKRRTLTHRQGTTNRNYTTLSTGKIIINRNINNQIKMMIRNFRKFN